jgi:nicotinate-nucleotide--dimethylbenzimidazole phosphoribosyltransferase
MNFNIKPVSKNWLEQARERQNTLTKPLGALGLLEEVGCRLAAIQQTLHPKLSKGAVVVCAADHGVTVEGVSAYPPEVTAQMVLNFQAGGAAINQIARAADAGVFVVDVGINSPLPVGERSGAEGTRIGLGVRVRNGTGNIAVEPAMTLAEAEEAILIGVQAARQAIASGATILAAGDMGIGNTTAAAALTAALLELPPEAVTGRGTGVDDGRYRHKLEVIHRALERFEATNLDEPTPLTYLSELGGLEIAAIAGVFLAGAEAGLPIMTDGFPVTAGALLACRINPNVRDYLFAGHRSVEPGHSKQLGALQLRPLLELELRLGEGTGAVLAFPLLRAAAEVMSGMATFKSAGVSDNM